MWEASRGTSNGVSDGRFFDETTTEIGGGRLLITAFSIRGIQVKDNVGDNKNENFAMLWEVLRHGLGYYCVCNTQYESTRRAAKE